jgi:hypothetical protein
VNLDTTTASAQADQDDSRLDVRLRRLSEEGVGTGLYWWSEALLVLTFYVVYSWSRNQFGSATVQPDEALRNAVSVIDLEKALGLFQELRIQEWFLDSTFFLQFWNLFYGTAHFAVTIFTLAWLYHRYPVLYPRLRSSFLCTTGLALVGFSLFPLMPPRLLADCGEFGGCLATYPFVDFFFLELPEPADFMTWHLPFTYPLVDRIPFDPEIGRNLIYGEPSIFHHSSLLTPSIT